MEKTEQFSDLLLRYQLKKTIPRLSVLSVLKSRKVATSQPDLEQIIGKDIDRVTLYRTLTTFEEKGIIHKILDINGTSNYAMCSSECTESQHKHEHVHFNCTNCLDLYCLDKLQIPKFTMPAGFTIAAANLVIYGVCDTCNKK